MRLKPSIDIVKFLDQTAKCRGTVLFTTPEGDRINLTSILSRYIFIVLISRPGILEIGTVICSDDRDLSDLKEYLQ